MHGMKKKIKRYQEKQEATERIALTAVDYAITSGVMTRTLNNLNSSEVVQHAPFTLFPSPVPRTLFEQALAVQKDFNYLMHASSQDYDFLKTVYESVLETDDFTRKLFEIHETVRNENPNKTELSIIRCDYMINQPDPETMNLKQVEINMIAAGLNGIGSEKMTGIHRHTLSTCGLAELLEALPENSALSDHANGFISAWAAYGKEDAVIVFIVSESEYNIFDQRSLEFKINEIKPRIKVRRYTLADVGSFGRLDDCGHLFINKDEIAVIYYRDGYSPNSYPTQKEWDARLMMDRSEAINCPSVRHQLVGAKKMQQVFAQSGVVEKYIKDEDVVKRIRDTFVNFYGLEMDSRGDAAVSLVMKNPENYVLKPQLEGGGNNLYGDDIVDKLKEIGEDKRRCSYIVMERIMPMRVEAVMLRSGTGLGQYNPVEVVSEIGTFGVILASGNNILQNTCAGHLLRTKESYHNDGGMAVGVAVVDSPLLV